MSGLSVKVDLAGAVRDASEAFHAFGIDRFPRAVRYALTHHVGHADYLLRYRTASGLAFAVSRTTKTGAKVWIPAYERWRAALVADGFDCEERECAGDGRGRIITLQAMPGFRGKRAYSVRVKTVGEALAVAAKLR